MIPSKNQIRWIAVLLLAAATKVIAEPYLASQMGL
jgi:hypothetical protein